MSKTILDVAKVIDSLHATPDYVDSGLPMVRVVDVNNSFLDLDACFLVDEETCNRHNKNHVPKQGDIIITRVGSYGMLAYVDTEKKFCLGQNIAIISPKKKDDGKFLYYYLQSPYLQSIIYGNTGGSSYKCIGLEQIKNLPLDIDGLECAKIGSLLYQIDKKIDNNKLISQKLDDMVKTIYDYWFLQFQFPSINSKPYKSSGGEMEWNNEFEMELPKGWVVDTLRGKFSIERGLSYSSKDIQSGEGVPMINLACIDINRNYRDGELKFFSGKTEIKDFLDADDLLIACTDLTRNADIVGCPILAPDDDNHYVYSMDIAKLVTNEDIFNKYYLYMTLRTPFYHNYIKKWASGTNVLHLNLDGLNWYKTWIPPKELQDKFAEIVKINHKKKSKIMRENHELQLLRDYLLPLLMNGQVKV